MAVIRPFSAKTGPRNGNLGYKGHFAEKDEREKQDLRLFVLSL